MASLVWAGASPVGSERFEVASAGFGALVAFNARELAVVVDDESLVAAADGLAAGLDAGWDPARRTWVDQVVVGPDGTGAVRTLEALLPVLVSGDDVAVSSAFDQALDGEAFGGAFGPAGTHRAEPAYDPRAYWRGPAWPQLTYLMWFAARRRGRPDVAAALSAALVGGARRSGFAEYWHPDTGQGGGAAPQSWATLAAVVSRSTGR